MIPPTPDPATRTSVSISSMMIRRSDQVLADDLAVHLVGAFDDPQATGVAIEALDRVLAGEAHAAVDLHRLVGEPVESRGRVELHAGDLLPEAAGQLPIRLTSRTRVVAQARGVINGGPRHVRLYGHVGEHPA